MTQRSARQEDRQKRAEGGAKGGGAEPKNFLIVDHRGLGAHRLRALVLSIYFVATTVRMFMELRPEVLTPLEVLEEARNFCRPAISRGSTNGSRPTLRFSARSSARESPNCPTEFPKPATRWSGSAKSNTITLEKKISMLAVLGTLGPMIGLLGTLKGMIGAFSVIAMSDTQLKASQVAGNISEALRADVRRGGPVGTGHLLLRPVPQPHLVVQRRRRCSMPMRSCAGCTAR